MLTTDPPGSAGPVGATLPEAWCRVNRAPAPILLCHGRVHACVKHVVARRAYTAAIHRNAKLVKRADLDRLMTPRPTEDDPGNAGARTRHGRELV